MVLILPPGRFCQFAGQDCCFPWHSSLGGRSRRFRWWRCLFFFVEFLILYELWAGERLVLEKALPRCGCGGRQISVWAVRLGPGFDIWRTRRFLCRLRRAFPREVFPMPEWREPLSPQARTSRSREVSSVLFLDELLLLFRCLASSGAGLLAGSLPLRFCSAGCASGVPTWSLPSPAQVAALVLHDSGDGDFLVNVGCGPEGAWGTLGWRSWR